MKYFDFLPFSSILACTTNVVKRSEIYGGLAEMGIICTVADNTGTIVPSHSVNEPR